MKLQEIHDFYFGPWGPDGAEPDGSTEFTRALRDTFRVDCHVESSNPGVATDGQLVLQLADSEWLVVEVPSTSKPSYAGLYEHLFSTWKQARSNGPSNPVAIHPFRHTERWKRARVRHSGATLPNTDQLSAIKYPISSASTADAPQTRVAPGAHETITDITNRYVNILKNQLAFQCCSIYLWSDHYDRLATLSSEGYKDEFRYQVYNNDRRRAVTLRMALRGELICGTKEYLEKKYPDDFTDRCSSFISGGFRNLLGIPLIATDRIAGVVKLENKLGDRHSVITRDDMNVAQAMCKQLLADLSNADAAFLKYRSSSMARVVSTCHEYAIAEPEPILLSGSIGSGRDTTARYIHHRSTRHRHPFRSYDCRREGIVELLKELAFPIGTSEHLMSLAELSGGTIYFANIDSLPRNDQAIIPPLVERLRDDFDIRVIASISMSLEDQADLSSMDAGILRLFAGSEIAVPPLCERTKEDIDILVRHFSEELYLKRGLGFPPSAEERAAFLNELFIGGREFPSVSGLRGGIVEGSCQKGRPLVKVLKAWRRRPQAAIQLPFKELPPDERERRVRVLWAEKMVGEHWTGTKLANAMGIDHRTLQKYMTKLGLRSPRSTRKGSEKEVTEDA